MVALLSNVGGFLKKSQPQHLPIISLNSVKKMNWRIKQRRESKVKKRPVASTE
jgi:hypothetical protein